MLTIRHVESCAHEQIFQVTDVSYQPENAGGTTAPETVFGYREPGHPLQFTDGLIYVMNDNGKTVAKYDLGARKQVAA
jgi:hypothetical protein